MAVTLQGRMSPVQSAFVIPPAPRFQMIGINNFRLFRERLLVDAADSLCGPGASGSRLMPQIGQRTKSPAAGTGLSCKSERSYFLPLPQMTEAEYSSL
jgi:hypothetical protein